MTQWNKFCQVVGDSLLGWSLRLPTDLTLLVLAGITAILLTLIRWATSDQDCLRRAHADKRQLRRLIREAKSRADSDAVARYRATLGLIRRRLLISEIVPLLVAIGPIAGLVTWCGQRLEFQPPRPGQTIQFELTTPAADAGKLVHLVPDRGITSDGWVKEIEPIADPRGRCGRAAWEIAAAPREIAYPLTVRYGGKTLHHDLRVGAQTYSPAVVIHEHEVTSRLRYEPIRLFGWLPGLTAIGLPPWMTAYLLLTLPLVFLLRRFLRMN